MNRTLSNGAAALAAALALAGCGGGSNNDGAVTPAPSSPKVTVQDLAPGSYIVSVGDANAPTVGKYYAGANGSRLLALANKDDQLDRLFKRDPGASSWTAIPAVDQDLQLALLRSDALVAQSADPAALAGNYAAALSDGAPARLRIAASGAITALDTACKLSGQLGASTLPSTLKLSLAASGCAGLPATGSGVLVIDSDYAPARFRLIADNGTQALDLWAYKE
ncbi:hypothetical protein ACIPRI_01135 [Variovorax sp. LARHSF232]